MTRTIFHLFVSVTALQLVEKQASSFLHVIAFTSPKRSYHYPSLQRSRKEHTLSLSNTNEYDEIEIEKASSKSTTVRFSGRLKISTAPVSLPKNNKQIISFFKENRNLLLSKEGNIQVISSPTESDMNNWKIKNDLRFQSSNNDNGVSGVSALRMDDDAFATKDEIVQVETMIKFPGLKTIAASILGARLVTVDDSTDYDDNDTAITFPEYQFTLLNSCNKAEGLPPAVWIYNLLTGNNKKTSNKNDMTSSYTTVKLERTNNDEYVFTSKSSLEVKINFPSTLLKMLPFSTDTLEERGSVAMQKALEKEVGPNLERFRDVYVKWINS